ncbi:FAD-binding oxidoreductase [Citromicrobium bathyomarinum]|uniref:NAD(P)/FAD-dependent oxidoreductase n=1 Tax=Citromicrobium bathyomarinum TaxID=72174 RepID=UPI00315AB902
MKKIARRSVEHWTNSDVFLSDIDFLVIGGGLVGAASAWHLASAGTKVWLCEQASPGHGASGQNAGSLHFQIERRFLEREDGVGREGEQTAQLSRLAVQDWRDLERQIGRNLGVHMEGGLMVAHSAQEVRLLEAKAAREQAMGLTVKTIDRAQVQALAPYLSPDILAANFMADEGHADARIIAPAFADAAQSAGARLLDATRVASLQKRGALFEARLEKGEEIQTVTAAKVLICAGIWSPQIAAMAGLHLPLFPAPLTMNATARTAAFLPYLIQHVGRRLSIKQTAAGNLLIGGGWPSRLHRTGSGFDFSRAPALVPQSLTGNLQTAVETMPVIGEHELLRSWTGITAVTQDQLPVAGEFPSLPGLFCAAGGSAFTLGPTFARLVADQMLERRRDEADALLSVASPARFESLNGFMGR